MVDAIHDAVHSVLAVTWDNILNFGQGHSIPFFTPILSSSTTFPFGPQAMSVVEFIDNSNNWHLLLYLCFFHVFMNLWKIVFETDWKDAILGGVFRFFIWTPIGKGIIAREKEKSMKDIRKEIHGLLNSVDLPDFQDFPQKGTPRTTLLKKFDNLAKQECEWREGKVFGYVYGTLPGHWDFTNSVYKIFSHTNPLHLNAFPVIGRMERDVTKMTGFMLGANYATNDNVCGTMTSGGTESILLAILSYRNYARENRGITKPELVLPVTAHAAFDKACEYFCIKPVKIDIGKDCRVKLSSVVRAINKNTIAIVGSAPHYPHGVIDDIEALSSIALKAGIGLHVDCCLGGFILPWLKKQGTYGIPDFDFRVPGVTSISADVHKYGLSHKGASIILYRSPEYLKHQVFATTEWNGGMYASPTVQGSRNGAIIATAYATLVSLGQEGYLEISHKIGQAAKKLKASVCSIPELEIIGEPLATVFAFRFSEESGLATLALGEAMSKQGWSIERQQRPTSLHCSTTQLHTQPGVCEKFAKDLKAAVEDTKANSGELLKEGLAPVYGSANQIPVGPWRSIIGDILKGYFTTIYSMNLKITDPDSSSSSEAKKHK